jgi:predicted DNA-binding helix-hairpin-helix protein
MRVGLNLRWVIWLLLPLSAVFGSEVLAETRPENSPTVAERIGNTAKRVGTKIEQGLTKAVKKLEDKKVGEKIERKLKKAVTKTEEGFKKAGKKIDQKLR